MLCEFQRVIYPSVPSPGSYMVALYHPCEQVKDLAGNVLEQIKAVGYCLPTAGNLRFDMQGRWKTNSKFGVQFEVESYDEVLVPTKEGDYRLMVDIIGFDGVTSLSRPFTVSGSAK